MEHGSKHFHIVISLGNEAMKSSEDVAYSLKGVISTLESRPEQRAGIIRDFNGNPVGAWEYYDDYHVKHIF